jgi:O-antigen ligase
MFGQSNVLSTHNLQSRQELWLRAIYINQDFALTGVGLGMVEPVIRLLYPTFLLPPEIRFNHVHNMYLQTGAELGLLGLVAHLSFYIVLFYLLLQRALDPNAGRNQILALGLLGSLITFLVQGFFDTITDSPQVAILVWGLFGLMMAVVTSSQADQSTPSLE